MEKLLSEQTTTLTDTLRRALVQFLLEETMDAKHDLLRHAPGLLSREACAVLSEQIDIELAEGNTEGAQWLTVNLRIICRFPDLP